MKISEASRPFLFQKRPDSQLTRGRRAAFWLWNILILLCAAAGVTGVMLLLAPGPYALSVFVGYFTHPVLFLLNLLPVALLMALGWAATGRPWAAYLFGAVPALLLAFGNYYKLSFRDDPVLFADLFILGEAGKMAGNYSLFLNLRLALVLLCAAGGFLFLFFLVRGKPSGRVRLITLAAVLLIGGLGAKPYLSDSLYAKTAVNLDRLSQWSDTQQFLSRGSMYPFLHSVTDAFPAAPEGYNKKETAALLDGYEDGDIPADQKVSVVGIMLEAFADFSRIDGVEAAPEVYAAYHALEEESYTGNLITNIFAGGTVNTERAFLTGVSTQYNWRRDTSSYVWYFKNQGYETSGDHPCFDWFYNRKNVNTYLGFESYRFVENYYGQFSGDDVAYDSIFMPKLTEDLLTRIKSGAPQFSFSVSYQGHGPYSGEECWWGEVDDLVGNRELDDESRTILANYLGSVKDTQERLSQMVDEFRDLDEPVILIVFGDHKPWLGNGSTVYQALGVNLDQSTEEGFYNYWSTRYLIWANDAAKEVLDFDFTGEGPDISPCFLMAHLFDKLGWTGDAYMQALRPVYGALPVIHDTGRVITAGGTLTSELTDEQRALIRQFRGLEYYRATQFSD